MIIHEPTANWLEDYYGYYLWLPKEKELAIITKPFKKEGIFHRMGLIEIFRPKCGYTDEWGTTSNGNGFDSIPILRPVELEAGDTTIYQYGFTPLDHARLLKRRINHYKFDVIKSEMGIKFCEQQLESIENLVTIQDIIE